MADHQASHQDSYQASHQDSYQSDQQVVIRVVDEQMVTLQEIVAPFAIVERSEYFRDLLKLPDSNNSADGVNSDVDKSSDRNNKASLPTVIFPPQYNQVVNLYLMYVMAEATTSAITRVDNYVSHYPYRRSRQNFVLFLQLCHYLADKHMLVTRAISYLRQHYSAYKDLITTLNYDLRRDIYLHLPYDLAINSQARMSCSGDHNNDGAVNDDGQSARLPKVSSLIEPITALLATTLTTTSTPTIMEDIEPTAAFGFFNEWCNNNLGKEIVVEDHTYLSTLTWQYVELEPHSPTLFERWLTQRMVFSTVRDSSPYGLQIVFPDNQLYGLSVICQVDQLKSPVSEGYFNEQGQLTGLCRGWYNGGGRNGSNSGLRFQLNYQAGLLHGTSYYYSSTRTITLNYYNHVCQSAVVCDSQGRRECYCNSEGNITSVVEYPNADDVTIKTLLDCIRPRRQRYQAGKLISVTTYQPKPNYLLGAELWIRNVRRLDELLGSALAEYSIVLADDGEKCIRKTCYWSATSNSQVRSTDDFLAADNTDDSEDIIDSQGEMMTCYEGSSAIRHGLSCAWYKGQQHRKRYQREYHYGKKDGVHTEWWDDGTYSEIQHYSTGRLHGRRTSFNRDGEVEVDAEYDNGQVTRDYLA